MEDDDIAEDINDLEIRKRIRSFLETKHGLDSQASYFILKAVLEDYWNEIRGSDTGEVDDEFDDFSLPNDESEDMESYSESEVGDVEDEQTITDSVDETDEYDEPLDEPLEPVAKKPSPKHKETVKSPVIQVQKPKIKQDENTEV